MGKLTPKYKRDDLVYSYQNKTEACPICSIDPRPWISLNQPHENDTVAYKLQLAPGRRSKWIDESSISTEPLSEV